MPCSTERFACRRRGLLAAVLACACWIGTAQAQPGGAVDPASRAEHPPVYPASAVAARQQGIAILRVLVDAGGRIEAIDVERSSGHPVLDAAAIEAAHRWRYLPAKAGGQPVAASIRVPIEFTLP